MSRGAAFLMVALAAGMALAAREATAQHELRWRFQPGETLRYARTTDRTTKVMDAGKTFTQTTKRTMELTWRVEKVDADGSARIAQSIDRIAQSIKNPRGEIAYDSAQPAAPTAAAATRLGTALKPLVAAAFSFTLTAQGEISDIALSDKTRKALESLPPNAAELLRDDALKFVVPTVPLPAEPVKPGTTWTRKTSFTDRLLGNRSLAIEYRDAGSETRDGKPLDKIDVKIETTVTPSKETQVQLDVKSMAARGTILFDRAAGRLVERSDTESARMNITNNGKTLEQVMEGTEVTTLRPASDPAPAKPVNP